MDFTERFPKLLKAYTIIVFLQANLETINKI
jgi:hypothetical protein